MYQSNQRLEIAILNRVLNFVLARGWKDYDNFCSKLSKKLAESKPKSADGLASIVGASKSPFFSLNRISVRQFVEWFPTSEILELTSSTDSEPITFSDVFPETETVNIATGKRLTAKLEIDEELIQRAIRDSVREKNATNAVERGKDSPLEVADHEHFSLKVNGKHLSFAGVVKGYKSLGKVKNINWEKVAYQVVRAYDRTHPDHVLLILAKNPGDSLVSELTEYGKSVGVPNLVVLCDPVNLARFLKARGVIS